MIRHEVIEYNSNAMQKVLMTQQEAIDIMFEGHNVFLTGEPGAGKTYTLNKFIEQARSESKRIAITASTGIAASHIDGQTIHSWSGLGIAESLSAEEIERYKWKQYVRDRYRNVEILIIDEVSMLHGYRLDMVERMSRAMRGDERPFGGLQVILVGDLFQLPPVTRGSQEADFVHQSEAWLKANLQFCYLTEQHRQGADDELLEILRSMRGGGISPQERQLLNSRTLKEAPEGITKLYTHNVDVDALNRQKLEELPGKIHTYRMHHDGDMYKVNAMKRNLLCPESLYLKEGAEVMFVANEKDRRFVNGTRGVVTGFTRHNEPMVRTIDGKELVVNEHSWKTFDAMGQRVVAQVHQTPLRLAWAVTVHKSQGMSLDEAEIDLSKAFTPGMGYVALSRVRSLKGLYLVGLGGQALDMDEDIREFDKKLKGGSNG